MKPVAQTVQKVTSLELSRAIKGAGAKQESEDFYARRGSKWRRYSNTTGPARIVGYDGIEEIVAAFDCVELLDELPGHISDGAKEYWLTLEKLSDEYHAMYCDYHHGPCGSAAVEVLGKLLLWGLENGYVEKREGDCGHE